MKGIIVTVLVLMSSFAVYGQDKTDASVPVKQDAPKAAPAKEGEKAKSITPPAQWRQDLNKFLALDKTLAELKAQHGIDSIEAQWQAQRSALERAIPKGYHYNETTGNWDIDMPAPPAPEKK